jgi:hypothetical protein
VTKVVGVFAFFRAASRYKKRYGSKTFIEMDPEWKKESTKHNQ